MKIDAGFLKPTKTKLILAILLALTSYVILVATKQVHEMQPGSSVLIGGTQTEVYFNPIVLAVLFPLSSLITLVAFSMLSGFGAFNHFVCGELSTCDLASGKSWLYLAALVINLPYYYLLSSLICAARKRCYP